MKISREYWVKFSHEEICKAMDWEYMGVNDPEAIFDTIINRIKYAEKNADDIALQYLLMIEGLELV